MTSRDIPVFSRARRIVIDIVNFSSIVVSGDKKNNLDSGILVCGLASLIGNL